MFFKSLIKRFVYLLAMSIAWIPLPVLHGFGGLLGWVIYWSDAKFAGRIRDNLKTINITSSTADYHKLLRHTVQESGKSMVETLALWMKSESAMLRWVKKIDGWEHVDAALQQKNGVLFLTPHLGCFEITSRYYATKEPVTILYRPTRQSWLSDLMNAGRARSQVKLAPTNLSGVRSLLKALKKGEAVGILPDQVPDAEEGVWATFFGQPAYTMNLVSKLVNATNATVLMIYGERLSWGRGFVIHIEPLNSDSTPQDINNAIERLVRKVPAQYLWSYQRFKAPKLTRSK